MSDAAISETDFTHATDGGPDDLPRTLRRERDAREREAREREHAERQERERQARERAWAEAASYVGPRYPSSDPYALAQAPVSGSVNRLDIPFFHLMGFFIKAVLAGIPALILLGALLWGAGHLLQIYFPQLVKMQILILFPPN
jgi:hypothetical protein